MSEEKYCKYQLFRRWVSYDSGVTWSPMDEYQKGELIERDSVDCGWEPTPPTPEVEYRWVDIPLADDFYCSGTTKYYKQKMQQSEDSGTTWTDVVPPQYRMGAIAQSESSDCGYASRTTSGSPYCDDGNKVVMIYYQVSDDHGASWTTTSSTENIIEYDVAECGYATRTTSGSPYCVGVDKCVDLYHQVTRDGGTTWTTTSTTVSVIEYNSEDCGYVPPTPTGSPYESQYLTLRAREDGTLSFTGQRLNRYPYRENRISYSTDNGQTWSNYVRTPSVQVSSGDTVLWKGTMGLVDSQTLGIGYFSSTNAFDVEGNPMSLIYGDDFSGQTSLKTYGQFHELFAYCNKLVNAENMVLVAPTLENNCYHGMFLNCSNLITTPVLSATTLAYDCYAQMFYGCTSLTTAPTLPATTLAEWCYREMFLGCTSLTTAPELPATTLANGCYTEMFRECVSLVTAPQLLATTLANSCYLHMFQDCTSLTAAPQLPATTLTYHCYDSMFSGCTSLTIAPTLSATALAEGCCEHMFVGCRSLTTAPVLPAPTLARYCYYEMFVGCTSLSAITCLATNKSEDNSTMRWVANVAPIGVFTKDASMNDWTIDSPNGIPIGWTVHDYPSPTPPTPSYSGDYLTFRARENGSFKFDKNGLSYSLDSGQTWTSIGANANTPTVASGATIMWKGTMTPSTTGYVGIGTFSSTKEFDAEGNVMSLLYGDNFSGQTSLAGTNYAFDALFYNCKLVNAENLSLPATTLGENCYNGMFFGCSGLTTAPQLPATTLAYGCYEDMFCYCRSLTTPPTLPATTLAVRCYDTMFRGCWSLTTLTALPATTLADSCYAYMFDSCSGLTTAPVLPATTLTPYCYCDMFVGCRSLTTAPVLPAPTLAEECYREMFVGCTSLSAITCLASDMSASNCTDTWVQSVASNGVFIKDANTTWSRGWSGIPNNWTIQDAT